MSKPLNQFGIKDAIKDNKANITINGIKDKEAVEMLQELIQDTYQNAKDYTDEQLEGVGTAVFPIKYGDTTQATADTLVKAYRTMIADKPFMVIAYADLHLGGACYIPVSAKVDTGKFVVTLMRIDTGTTYTTNGIPYNKVTTRTVSVGIGGSSLSWTAEGSLFIINDKSNIVGRNNTTAWTPNQLYGLVHKKYVDDGLATKVSSAQVTTMIENALSDIPTGGGTSERTVTPLPHDDSSLNRAGTYGRLYMAESDNEVELYGVVKYSQANNTLSYLNIDLQPLAGFDIDLVVDITARTFSGEPKKQTDSDEVLVHTVAARTGSNGQRWLKLPTFLTNSSYYYVATIRAIKFNKADVDTKTSPNL